MTTHANTINTGTVSTNATRGSIARGALALSTLTLLALASGGCAVEAGAMDADVEAAEETSMALTISERWSTLEGQREGWAKDVKGGKDGTLYTVTNLNNEGDGSLRKALESSNAYYIVFASNVNGTIELDRAIDVQSHKTVDARGSDITITTEDHEPDGLLIENATEIVLVNLRFDDNWEDWDLNSDGSDAIHIDNSSNIWIHHCRFEEWRDGAIDIGTGNELDSTSNLSVTWSKFARIFQPMKWNGDELSFGHNFCVDVHARCVKIQQGGRVHSYNNYIKNWSSSNILQAEEDGQIYAQRNIFNPGSDTNVGKCNTNGKIEDDNNRKLNGVSFACNVAVDAAFAADSRANATVYSCGSSDSACWNSLQVTLVDGSSSHAAAGDNL